MPTDNPKQQAILAFKLVEKHSKLIKSETEEIFVINNQLNNFVPLRSTSFKNWLMYMFNQENNSFLEVNALNQTLNQLEALYSFKLTERHSIASRVGHHDNKIYINLNDEEGNKIEISTSGWKVTRNSPLIFQMDNNNSSMPLPKGRNPKDLLRLRHYLGLDEKEFMLVISFLLSVYMPTDKYPVLYFQGGESTAKTFRTKLIKLLLDPSKTTELTIPKSEQNLFAQARGQHLVTFDNVSQISRNQADWLCKLSTTSSFSTRKLFSDLEGVYYSLVRPIVLNSIEELTDKNDLLSRMIYIKLPKLKDLKSSSELMKSLNEETPYILGGLFSILSHALKKFPSSEIKTSSRFIDFIRWITCCEEQLGLPSNYFNTLIQENNEFKVEDAMEKNIFLQLLIEIIEKSPNPLVTTPTQLFNDLKDLYQKKYGEKDFKIIQSIVNLKDKIVRNEKMLNSLGISFSYKRKAIQRTYIFTKD
ncbi:hypothetical protein MUN89_18115 [Halobacillus salinarum]|uniref:Uncharacterized protein n=1 Tax=Halobacillus salinarum TaxID=2932257 RepID=A0ABY4EIF1_9BACI|nr:hypothetical protein [Halobacillus salinarum]UOQ43775.1 hypothetical protein MUN89_18115 [Halobacillus salinarum]